MARKKQLLTIDQLTKESNGALIPECEENSPEREGMSEKKEAAPLKRGRVKRKEEESFKKSLSKILNMVISPETVAQAVRSTPLGENITYQEAILIAQILKASNGDTQAATFLRDSSGNKLKETTEKESDIKSFEDF